MRVEGALLREEANLTVRPSSFFVAMNLFTVSKSYYFVAIWPFWPSWYIFFFWIKEVFCSVKNWDIETFLRIANIMLSFKLYCSSPPTSGEGKKKVTGIGKVTRGSKTQWEAYFFLCTKINRHIQILTIPDWKSFFWLGHLPPLGGLLSQSIIMLGTILFMPIDHFG